MSTYPQPGFAGPAARPPHGAAQQQSSYSAMPPQPPYGTPQEYPGGPPPAQGPQLGIPAYAPAGGLEEIQSRIEHRDSNSMVYLRLAPNQQVKAKPGSMVAMDATCQIKGKLKFSMKKMLTGGEMTESTFTGPGEVLLAPETWGDIVPIRIDPQTNWNVGRDAFLACTMGVSRTTKSQGLGKGLFSSEGIFVYHTMGAGTLWVTSLGAITSRTLHPGEQWIVDNGHLVAWTAQYKVERINAGGFLSAAHTDEGLVCRFTGPGIVYIQTRNPEALGNWIAEQVPASGGRNSGI